MNIVEKIKSIVSRENVSKWHANKPLMIVAVFFVLTLVFSAGVFVGFEKARFSHGWGENYYRNFVGGRGMLGERDYKNAHGSTGEIIRIDGNNLIIRDRDNTESNVQVASSTSIQSKDGNMDISDLKIGDRVIIIGSPNDSGQIEAKFIRMGPPTPPSLPFYFKK